MNVSLHLRHTLTGHGNDINGIAFMDGMLATGSGDKTVKLWRLSEDMQSVELQATMKEHSLHVHRVAFDVHLKKLYSASTDGKVLQWSVTTGAVERYWQLPSRTGIRSLALACNSAVLVAGGESGEVCAWDRVTGEEVFRSHAHHHETVQCLTLTSDSRLVISGDSQGYLWVHSVPEGKSLIRVTEAHDLGVVCCAVDGLPPSHAKEKGVQYYGLATGGNDDLVKIWAVAYFVNEQKVKVTCRLTLKGHTAQIMGCTYSHSALLLASCSGDHTVRLWNPFSGLCVSVLEAHERFVTCCAFSLDDAYLATGSNDCTVKLWRVNKNAQPANQSNAADLRIVSPEKPMGQCSSSCDSCPSPKSCAWHGPFPRVWSVDLVARFVAEVVRLPHKACWVFNAQISGARLLQLDVDELLRLLCIDSLEEKQRFGTELNRLKEKDQSANRTIGKTRLNTGEVPSEFKCPITLEVMREPVLAADGHTYDRHSMETWFTCGGVTSPMTNQLLTSFKLVDNILVKQLIAKFLQRYPDNSASGKSHC